jgi:DNA-binding response OmpR family regulator
MRPRKIVLIVDSDQNSCSTLAFLLKTYEFLPLKAATHREAVAHLAAHCVDLVFAVHDPPAQNGIRIVADLKKRNPGTRMVLLASLKAMAGKDHPADAMIARHGSTVELLSLVRVMSARKRGPRHKIPSPSQPAASIAAQGVPALCP